MELRLERVQKDPDVTIGKLYVDDALECWTLEDTVRPDGVKIFGETAIPAGRYDVQLTMSPRFNRVLPLLINVAGFVGIRIHPGNTAKDTDGCILVGRDRLAKSIGRSREAFDQLYGKLGAAVKNREPIHMVIA